MSFSSVQPLRLRAFFPHPDTVRALDSLRPALFAAGFLGAYALPACAVLGFAEKPASPAELDALAAEARGSAKFAVQAPELRAFDERIAPWALCCPIEGLGVDAAFGLILAVGNGTAPPVMPFLDLDFPLSFSAGYTANLALAPARGTSGATGFEWKRGKPHWLPKRR